MLTLAGGLCEDHLVLIRPCIDARVLNKEFVLNNYYII